MDPNRLIKLKTEIENIPKIHHVKILQILINNKIKFSEISEQEKTLNDVEKEKSFYQTNYFKNSNKDNN